MDRPIHAGRRARDTCSERNSLQLCSMARHTITATTTAANAWAPQYSPLRINSGLHESVNDRTGEQRECWNGGMEIRAAGALQSETAHLAEARHRLPGPGVQVALVIRDPQQIPDDLLEMIRIRDGHDQHARGLQEAMDFADRLVRIRQVLENLEAKGEVVGVGRERQPLRNVVDQDVGLGERRVDLDALISYVLREHVPQSAVARADVEDRRAGGHARHGRSPAEPHPFRRRGVPGGASDVKIGEIAGLVGQGSENLTGRGTAREVGRCRRSTMWAIGRWDAGRYSPRLPSTTRGRASTCTTTGSGSRPRWNRTVTTRWPTCRPGTSTTWPRVPTRTSSPRTTS